MQASFKVGSPPFLLRAFYFLFVGWWLGLAWGYIALVLCLLILPITLGQWMFRQMPQLLTLATPPLPPRPESGERRWSCPFLLRCLYFLFVGSWLGIVVFHVGLVLCLLVLPLKWGQSVLRSLPTFFTLASPPVPSAVVA